MLLRTVYPSDGDILAGLKRAASVRLRLVSIEISLRSDSPLMSLRRVRRLGNSISAAREEVGISSFRPPQAVVDVCRRGLDKGETN